MRGGERAGGGGGFEPVRGGIVNSGGGIAEYCPGGG